MVTPTEVSKKIPYSEFVHQRVYYNPKTRRTIRFGKNYKVSLYVRERYVELLPVVEIRKHTKSIIGIVDSDMTYEVNRIDGPRTRWEAHLIMNGTIQHFITTDSLQAVNELLNDWANGAGYKKRLSMADQAKE